MKKIKNSTHYHNVLKFEELEIILITEKAQINSDLIVEKVNIMWVFKKNSNSKKITIIKMTSLLMIMINLTVKAIKTVSRISIQQSSVTETVKDSINSQIINLIMSVLSLMKSDSIRILKNLWWLKFSLLILLNLKSQLNLSRFSIKQLNLSTSQLND